MTAEQKNENSSPQKIITVIACDVLRDEVNQAAGFAGPHVQVHFLEQGLHNEPDRLRDRLQEAIDEVEENPGESIALAYGICCRGTEGIAARTRPLVIPRAHDCITLLLGCRKRYAEHVKKTPGTYWYSPGWNRCHVPPGPQRAENLRREYVEKYGEDNADYLMEMEQSWLSEYDRATYVHLGAGDSPKDRAFTKECADWLGWSYEEIDGDRKLLFDLVRGDWDHDRFLVLQPGQSLTVTADDRIIDAKDAGDAAS